MIRSAALVLALVSCGALSWPSEAPELQASAACRCLDQPAPPLSEPEPEHAPAPESATAQRVVTTTTGVLGIATGNPVAWNLIGMLASHLIGATRRRKGTT